MEYKITVGDLVITGNSDSEFAEEAAEKLNKLVNHVLFGKPGYRNDSIVDMTIFCNILDIDVLQMLKDLFNHWRLDAADYNACVNKYYVVEPYAEGWMWAPLNYEIGTFYR